MVCGTGLGREPVISADAEKNALRIPRIAFDVGMKYANPPGFGTGEAEESI